MPMSVFVAIPLMVVLTVLQTAVLPHFPLFGYVPQLSFLVVVAWTVLEGQQEGLVWAFTAGIIHDLFTIAPVGGTALTYMVAVLVVSAVVDYLPSNRFLVLMVVMALATIVQQLLYYLFLRIFGYGISFPIMAQLLPMAVLNAVAILPVYWLLAGANRVVRPRPVKL